MSNSYKGLLHKFLEKLLRRLEDRQRHVRKPIMNVNWKWNKFTFKKLGNKARYGTDKRGLLYLCELWQSVEGGAFKGMN